MGDRITCQPRRFKIGDKCAIEVKEQVAIANMLIVDITGDQETSDRETVLLKHVIFKRKTAFANFYRGESGCQTYRAWDVPHIASRYLDMWGFELTEHRGVGGVSCGALSGRRTLGLQKYEYSVKSSRINSQKQPNQQPNLQPLASEIHNNQPGESK